MFPMHLGRSVRLIRLVSLGGLCVAQECAAQEVDTPGAGGGSGSVAAPSPWPAGDTRTTSKGRRMEHEGRRIASRRGAGSIRGVIESMMHAWKLGVRSNL
jgi:hypothetical protein